MKLIYDYKIFFDQTFGGPSRYFVELIKELINMKQEVTVLSPIYVNQYLKNIEKKYKKGFYIKNKNFLGSIFKVYNNFISNSYLKRHSFDVLHTTYYDNCLISKKPTVITVYDLIHEIYSKDFNFTKLPKQEIFKKIDHFICISKNTQKDLIKYYGIEEKKTSVIYLSNFKINNGSSKTFNHKKSFFLYVGSRKRYKNFTLLVKAFCKNNFIYDNFDIICFGGGKFIREELDLFNALKLDLNKIHQTDGNDDLLLSLYKSATAYICTSRYEGFGLPILEAMSNGCPVVSSNTSSLPEVYGDAALSFSPNSLEELLNCLNNIVKDNSLRESLVIKGLERVKNFSWEKCAKETLEVYKNLS